MKNALFLIDMQYDFCSPKGSLYVPGAEEDCQNIKNWIYKNIHNIDSIFFSMDYHIENSIFHPLWFVDEDNKFPKPFAVIKHDDLVDGKWKVLNPENKEHTERYLKNLESIGKSHVIWPVHCIQLSMGGSIDVVVLRAIMDWEWVNKKRATPILKGIDPKTEQYGVFKPQFNSVYDVCENEDCNECNFMLEYYNKIFLYHDNVYIAGEAMSHCVGETLNQVIKYKDRHPQKANIHLFEDCTSNVPGYKDQGEMYKNLASNSDVTICKSTNIVL